MISCCDLLHDDTFSYFFYNDFDDYGGIVCYVVSCM
jgi:hypothetical protein